MRSKTISKKLIALIFVTTSIFFGCQKETGISIEEQGHKKIQRITVSELTNRIGKSDAFVEIENMIKVENRDIIDIEIQTDEIVLIEENNYRYYTLKLINNDPNEDDSVFYNLIFNQEISSGEVISSIYKYEPDPSWLSDTSQAYYGTAQILTNDYFILDDVYARGGAGKCIIGVDFGWECDAGNPHSPADYESGVCVVGGNEYYINFETGPCQDPTVTTIDDDGNSSGGGSSGGGGSSSTVVLVPCDDDGGFGNASGDPCIPVDVQFAPHLSLNQSQIDWIFENEGNTTFMEIVLATLESSNLTQEEKIGQMKQAYENLYPLINTNDPNTYAQDIQRMTNHLRLFGSAEDEFIADYADSLALDFPNMNVGEMFDVYLLVRETCNSLTVNYLNLISIEILDAALPFIIFAVTEATLGAALPLLSRLPIVLVLRGIQLSNTVCKIGLLGVQGTSNSIRLVRTTSPVSKASGLFQTLTRNAISVETQANGAIVANMGNGNTIVYRTIQQSGSNANATLNLNFPEIWTTARVVKFLIP